MITKTGKYAIVSFP